MYLCVTAVCVLRICHIRINKSLSIAAMIKEHYRTPEADSLPMESERNVCQSLDDPDLEGWNNDEEIVW